MELFPAGCVIIDDVAVTRQPVFIGNKTFKAYGTAGMDLAGAHADLGTEAVTEAVGKPC